MRILARPRHHAHRAEVAERRDQRDLVSDVDVERLGQLAAETSPGRSGGAEHDLGDDGIEVVAQGRQLRPLRVLLAGRADADHLVGGEVPQLLRVREVRELVVHLLGRLDVLAADR